MGRSESRAEAGRPVKYCADTWFILSLYDNDTISGSILRDVREGKTRLVIPIIVYAESWKKLLQRGCSEKIVMEFYDALFLLPKIEMIQIDENIAKEAAMISINSPLSLIDAIVAATARLTECDVLLSGDNDYLPLIKKKYIKVKSW